MSWFCSLLLANMQISAEQYRLLYQELTDLIRLVSIDHYQIHSLIHHAPKHWGTGIPKVQSDLILLK